MPFQQRQISDFPLWTYVWAVLLSAAWLAPHHYPPWSAFHGEAWSAFMMLCMALAAGLRWRTPAAVPIWSRVLLGLFALTWLQWAIGDFSFTGVAWLISGYFGMAALVVWATAHWSRHAALAPADALFAAILIAALVSVGLQMDQWLRTHLLDIWSMGGDGTRPYANMGQPNLLSTFQLWGLLGVLWAVQRGILGAVSGTFVAMVLLFGVALTQSRTGWLSIGLMFALLLYWRRLWRWKQLTLAAIGLAVWFVMCVRSLTWLSSALQVAAPPALDGRLAVGSDLRLRMWQLLFDASFQHPWLGFGIGNIFRAQVEAPDPALAIQLPTGHAHNLILDGAISIGWPLTLVLTGALGVWLWRTLHRIHDPLGATMFMAIVTIGVHAMLELPLHHMHFLLPTCMFIAMMPSARPTPEPQRVPSSLWMSAIAVGGLALLSLITVDYLRTETSLTRLRMEWNRVGKAPPGGPPDVFVLNQFHDWIKLLRFEPTTGMSGDQVQWVRNVTNTIPAAAHFYLLAKALALNGQPQEAAVRLRQLCDVFEPEKCQLIRQGWASEAKTSPQMAAVAWPKP